VINADTKSKSCFESNRKTPLKTYWQHQQWITALSNLAKRPFGEKGRANGPARQ